MNRFRVRSYRFLVLLPLLLSALLLVETSPATAKPTPAPCASSKIATIKRDYGNRPAPRKLWTRVCAANGSLNVLLRQRNIGHRVGVEDTIEAQLKIVVYSTSSNGKFLKGIEFEQVVPLGDVAAKFASGGSTRYGGLTYLPSMEVPSIALPALRPGVYQVGFETVFYPAVLTPPGAFSAPVTTGMKYLKVKVSESGAQDDGSAGGGSRTRA